MSDSQRVSDLKFQVSLLEKKYLDQSGRRDAVRASFAVPMAALSFAAFGFGALSNSITWDFSTSWMHAMAGVLVIVLSLLAVFSFMHAIVELSTESLETTPVDAGVNEFVSNAEVIQRGLEEDGVDPKDAYDFAMQSALETLADEYIFSTEEFSSENKRKLEIQTSAYRRLLLGLACIILSIALSLIR